MIHIVHMIQHRLDGRPVPAAIPLLAVSALALLAGLGLLPGR